MVKIKLLLLLLCCYSCYSYWIYNNGTANPITMPDKAIAGKRIWQNNNCQNCHQMFGLGGYMGPDLTTVMSDKHRGKDYAKAIIMSGGNQMPKFGFSDTETEELLAWLAYADQLSRNKTNQW